MTNPEPEAQRSALPAAPVEQWRCFHCGMVLTTEQSAREHFGKTRFDVPACEAVRHPAVQALRFQHYHAVKAVRDVLSDLIDACYTEGSSSAWRLCGVCETEHHQEATVGDQTHTKGCAVDEAEKVLRKPIDLPYLAALPAAPGEPALDLAPIKARVNGLGIEPWFYTHSDGCLQPHTVGEGRPRKWIAVCSSPWDHDGARRDMEFIAHARMDIPALIAEVERLRAALPVVVTREGQEEQEHE